MMLLTMVMILPMNKVTVTRGVDPHGCFRSMDLVGDSDNVACH